MSQAPGRLPQTLGVFCAIPLTRQEFDHDLRQPGPKGDYVKNVLCGAGEYQPDLAWQIYTPTAEFARTKLDQLHSLGVDIFPRSAASRFSENVDSYQVAIVIAHWKGPNVFASDIPLPDKLALRLLGDADEEISFLRELVGFEALAAMAQAAEQRAGGELTRLLQTVLDRLIEDHDLAPGGESEDPAARNRDHLVNTFSPLLCQGNGVEFVDRLVSVSDFVRMVPEAYDGVLDLTVCHSVNLANLLARERPNCVCVSNALEASPDLRLTRLSAVCQLMSAKKLHFLPALSEAQDMVDELFANTT